MQRTLGKSGTPGAKVRFRFDGNPDLPYHCDIDRTDKAGFTIHLAAHPTRQTIKFPTRILPVLHALANTSLDVRHMDFNMSDGDQPSPAGFAYSGSDPDLTLLPDFYFFEHRGFAKARELASHQTQDWRDRSRRISWRGGLNGRGETDVAQFAPDQLVQRLNLALLGPVLPDADIKLVRNPDDIRSVTKEASLYGEFVPETNWLNDRYAIDIDGWTNSWSNFLVRLHYGCCVLKIESRYGYRQWYYDRIKPWDHFVPVRADLADLAEKIDWVRSNESTAEEIAMRGQAFARTMTFESEMAWAASAIQKRVDGS